MPEVKIRNLKGDVVGNLSLPEESFGGEVKEHLVHDVVVMQLANRRKGSASTLNKGRVKGSTAKPWRQKGTGRARVGSRKSPIWRGGGTIFGPTPRDYSYRTPKKVRRQALRCAMVDKIRNDGMIVLESMDMEEPKTKLFVSIMRDLGVNGSALVLTDDQNQNIRLSARNIPNVKTLNIIGLNVYDLLYYDKVLISKDLIPQLEKALA